MIGRTLLLVSVLVVSFQATPVHADEATDQAVWLLRQSMLVHRDGQHNVLLRALRQLRDPTLEPLFSELVQRRFEELKIHGMLGLAEIHDPPKLDLALVADIKDAGTQARVLSAAIDSDLLSIEDAKVLAGWPGLDPAVRVLVAGKLIASGEKVDPQLIADALTSDNEALRGMAALLQLQTGNADAMNVLDEINQTDTLRRDVVRKLLLQTAMKHEFAVIGPWAMKIVNQPDIEQGMFYQSLRTALMFKTPGATDVWTQRFKTSDSTADRLRLAVLAVDIADRLEPQLFAPVVADDMKTIHQIGIVGQQRASGQVGADAVVELVRLNNLLGSTWALQYATEVARKDSAKAVPMLVALVKASDDDYLVKFEGETKPRFLDKRLEFTVLATQLINEEVPQRTKLLRDLFEAAPMLTQEAMLMGLIRSGGDDPQQVIAGMNDFASRTAETMALLLRAKHAAQMPQDQLDQLAVIVRGGTGLRKPLRIQAAWVYLKLIRQERFALAKALGGD